MFQMKENRVHLKDLMAGECVIAPCVYDCASAKAAEICGYKALLLSGGEIEEAGMGLPNLGLHTIDALVDIVYNITSISPLPVSVDMDNGFGEPLAVYRNCDRLIRAGASAIQLEDKACEGTERLLPRKAYIAKIRAAVAACEGTDCMVVARNHVSVAEDPEEAVARALEALEAGAHMTLCLPKNMQEARFIAERVPGWKMFPDIGYKNRKPTASVPELAEMGYNLVTMHFFLKAAMNAMIQHGRENLKNMNNAYTSTQEIDGIYGASGMPFLKCQEFFDFEERFTGEHKIWSGPAPR